MEKVIIIGMGVSPADLTAAHLEIIHSADLLMGGRRYLDPFVDLAVEKYLIGGNVAEVIEILRRRKPGQRVVVLASGDPLLFGIGARICRELGEDQVIVLPNVSAIAAAFARIKTPWDDAAIVSLHGRQRQYHLLDALKSHDLIGVLTDPERSPQWLAGWLLERGVDRVDMAVCEQLGTPREKIRWYPLQAAAECEFSQPNVVILKRRLAGPPPGMGIQLGMADTDFAHERGLITKAEVRAVSLAKLRLKPGLTLWDLGAGSGAVGIEAAALLGAGRIFAVEQKAERVAQIRENARRLGAYNHQVIQARLPDGLDPLPRADRIFVGGGGRHLAAIIDCAGRKLGDQGILVANTVLMDNLTGAVSAMAAAGMTTEVVQLQISRSKTMPWSRRLEAENPVWVITGYRDKGER